MNTRKTDILNLSNKKPDGLEDWNIYLKRLYREFHYKDNSKGDYFD